MVADCFTGMSRVARGRAVNEALAEEFASGLHALSLTLRAPGELAGKAEPPDADGPVRTE